MTKKNIEYQVSKADENSVEVKEIEGFRNCSKCGDYIVEGFMNEENGTYYCTEKCLESVVPPEDKKEWIEEEVLFWTDWFDEAKVYSIFDNQYISYEDAEFIKENHGKPSEIITVRDLNLNEPVFIVKHGKQIEIELLKELPK